MYIFPSDEFDSIALWPVLNSVLSKGEVESTLRGANVLESTMPGFSSL